MKSLTRVFLVVCIAHQCLIGVGENLARGTGVFFGSLNPQGHRQIFPAAGMDPEQETLLIPSLGVYGDPYQFARPLATVEFDPEHFDVSGVPPALGTEIERLKSAGAQIEFFATILVGGEVGGEKIKDGATVNFVAHPVIARIMKQETVSTPLPSGWPFFKVDVRMGAFGADGVTQSPQAASLPFDRVGALDVNYHNHTNPQISPSNAQLIIDKGRTAISFWSLIEFRNRAVVTFTVLVLANSVRGIGEQLNGVGNSSNTNELVSLLGALAAGVFVEPNVNPFKNFQRLVGQEAPPSITDATGDIHTLVRRVDGGGLEINSKIGQFDAAYLDRAAKGEPVELNNPLSFVNHDCSIISLLSAQQFLADQYNFQRHAVSAQEQDILDLSANSLWTVMSIAPQLRREMNAGTGDLNIDESIASFNRITPVRGTKLKTDATFSFALGRDLNSALFVLAAMSQGACMFITESDKTSVLCHKHGLWAFFDSHGSDWAYQGSSGVSSRGSRVAWWHEEGRLPIPSGVKEYVERDFPRLSQSIAEDWAPFTLVVVDSGEYAQNGSMLRVALNVIKESRPDSDFAGKIFDNLSENPIPLAEAMRELTAVDLRAIATKISQDSWGRFLSRLGPSFFTALTGKLGGTSAMAS